MESSPNIWHTDIVFSYWMNPAWGGLRVLKVLHTNITTVHAVPYHNNLLNTTLGADYEIVFIFKPQNNNQTPNTSSYTIQFKLVYLFFKYIREKNTKINSYKIIIIITTNYQSFDANQNQNNNNNNTATTNELAKHKNKIPFWNVLGNKKENTNRA